MTADRENRRSRISHVWDVCVALAAVASLALARPLREVPRPSSSRNTDNDEYRRDLHSYIWGLVLALTLTSVPFALVYWTLLSRDALICTIGAFALVQIVVHFRFFLHINPPKQKVDDLQLILFSSLILIVMAGGTIWIMANLAVRMM